MTGQATTDVETLKKRLNEQQRAVKLLEQQGKSDNLLYQRLLGKLALACRGQNLELDNKLALLRAQLADNADLNKSQKLLEAVETLLGQQAQHAEQQLASTRDAIASAGKKLQQVRGLDPQVRRDLRELLASADATPQSVLHYLPHLEQLSSLYQQALLAAAGERDKLQLEQAGQQIAPATTAASNQRLTSLQQEIADLLLALLGEIEFDQETATELGALRRDLVLATSADQLLGYCTQLIQALIAGIKRERSLSASFLASLNDTLAAVSGAVNRSLAHSEYLSTESRQLNQMLHQRLVNLSSYVSSATDLNSLRDGINSQLGSILEAIEAREQLSVSEEEINTLLSELRQQIHGLKKETGQYRSQLAAQRQQLLVDPLTQLPNRSAFDERLQIEFERFSRYNRPLSLAIIDVDLFKRINDNYGHTAGDKTLHVLGQLFAKSFRRSDFVARYGGEEFVCLLPDTELAGAMELAETIRLHILEQKILHAGSTVYPFVSISLGVCCKETNSTCAPEDLLLQADSQLYQAKKNGRNQTCGEFLME